MKLNQLISAQHLKVISLIAGVIIMTVLVLSLLAPDLMSNAISRAIQGLIDFFFVVFEL